MPTMTYNDFDPLSRPLGRRDRSVVRVGPGHRRPTRGQGHVPGPDRPQRCPIERDCRPDPPHCARVTVETVAADLSTRSGVAALLDHVGTRPIEVLVNNAGFGSYGPFAEADPDRETDEVAVDVSAVIALARAFLPGMLARRSGGILNVASTIAFQPAPYQAVYGASKSFVLSFSQALWAEARAAGVAVTALCPGPTRTGFVDALGADVGHTAIYSRLSDPEPVIEAGLRALDNGRAVVIPGVRNKVIAASGRFMPREWLTLVSARLLRPVSTASRPPIEVRNEIVIPASAEHVWDLLADVERWPSWYRACRWVRVEPTGSAASAGSAARHRASLLGGRHTRSSCAAPLVTADRPHMSIRKPSFADVLCGLQRRAHVQERRTRCVVPITCDRALRRTRSISSSSSRVSRTPTRRRSPPIVRHCSSLESDHVFPRSNASASCAGVQPFVGACSRTRSASATLRSRLPALKARVAATPIVWRQIVNRPEAPRKKAAAERTVGDQRDPQLPQCRDKFVLRIATEQRVFGLHRRDGMHAHVRAAGSPATPPTGRDAGPCPGARDPPCAPTVSSMGTFGSTR